MSTESTFGKSDPIDKSSISRNSNFRRVYRKPNVAQLGIELSAYRRRDHNQLDSIAKESIFIASNQLNRNKDENVDISEDDPTGDRIDVIERSASFRQSEKRRTRSIRSEALAVDANNVSFKYGNRWKQTTILDNVCVNVYERSIYGLLGPSSCGKTTLLKCIVGLLKPKSGEIKVFGTVPGSKHSSVPGVGVGYMPQENALYDHFTINEMLTYFGTLYAMDRENIKHRIQFLAKFLDLPKTGKMIANLSGGQKRRVSLSVALVHSPPLLILDEPTVGVDPLLRERIWKHLIELTKTDGMAIIITTHYVEEARRADLVAFMREGRVLLEQNPSEVLQRFGVSCLEDVFLKISQLYETNRSEGNDENNQSINQNTVDISESYPECSDSYIRKAFQNPLTISNYYSERNRNTKLNQNWLHFSQIMAIIYKNYIQLRRNLPTLCFCLILPALQMILFCMCIGRDPKEIKVAVYNPETFNSTNTEAVSYRLLRELESGSVRIKQYATADEAIKSVKTGDNWAALVFSDDYSDSLMNRLIAEPFYSVDNITVEKSTIKLYADMTNFQVMQSLFKELTKVTDKDENMVYESLSKIDGANPYAGKSPFHIEQPPIYGTTDLDFRHFAAPGLISVLIYIMAVVLTTLTFVNEAKSGQSSRTYVAGIRAYQVIVAHIAVQFIILLIQIALLLVTTFIVYDIPNEGSIVLIIFMSFLQGLVGMCLGFFISAICETTQTSLMLSFGLSFPTIVMSGIIWPIESQPKFFRYLSYPQTQTLSVAAFRSVMLRGWDLSHVDVWLGIVSSVIWIFVFIILTAFSIRLK